MGFLDILAQYAQGGSVASAAHAGLHFDELAAHAAPDAVGGGIAAALRGDSGESFAASVEQLFGSSDADQKAGLLSHLIQAVEPAALSSVAGGALARFVPRVAAGTSLAPGDAETVSPSQAAELAAVAERHDPGVIERVGGFYAQHPTLVKALGAAALTIAMNHIADRTRT